MSILKQRAISFLGLEVWLSQFPIGTSGDLSSLLALLLTHCVTLVDAAPLGLSFSICAMKKMDQLLVRKLLAQSL